MADIENRPPSAKLPSPGKKKGRRSWFTPGRTSMLAMEIKCEKREPEPSDEPENDIDLLVLSHFTNPPRMDFGKMRPGKSKTKTLILRNPHEYEQEVIIEKFPFKKDFYVDFTRFTVGAEREVHLQISWTPVSEQNCREMVLFHINGVFRLQAYLFGSAVEPPKPKKRKVWKPPMQKVNSQPIRSKTSRGNAESIIKKPQRVLKSVQNVMSNQSEESRDTPKRKSRSSGGRSRTNQYQGEPCRKSDDFIVNHREVDLELQQVRDTWNEREIKSSCDDKNNLVVPEIVIETDSENVVPDVPFVSMSNRETFVQVQPMSNRETFVQVQPMSDLRSVGRETFAVVQPRAVVESQGMVKPKRVDVPKLKVDDLSIMFDDDKSTCQTPDSKENVRRMYTPRSMRRSVTYTKALQLTISPKQRKRLETSPENVETSAESGIDCTPLVAGSSEWSSPDDLRSPKSDLNLSKDSLLVTSSKSNSVSYTSEVMADSDPVDVSVNEPDCNLTTPVTPNSFLQECMGNSGRLSSMTSSQIPSPAVDPVNVSVNEPDCSLTTPVTPNSFLQESRGNSGRLSSMTSSLVPSPAVDPVNVSVNEHDCSLMTPVTPNSFLQESRGNSGRLSSMTSSLVPSPAVDPVNVSVNEHDCSLMTPVTPNSFLRESLGNSGRLSALFSSQVPIPSPAVVLGSSIPHNVMVKRLEMVKTSVQDRLSFGMPSKSPRSPSRPKSLFTIGTNFPTHSPKGFCMPRLGLDVGHKLINSGTVTKESKFAPAKNQNTGSSTPERDISSRLFCPSPTTERREIFISPSHLNPASLEIPHTPDLLIRRMTVTKDKPTVLKPSGSNSCKRLFPGYLPENQEGRDTTDETIMAQSLHDESIFSVSTDGSEQNKSVPPSTGEVREYSLARTVSGEKLQPPKRVVNGRRSNVRNTQKLAQESKPNSRTAAKMRTASAPAAQNPPRRSNTKPTSKKSPGIKRESSPLSKTEPALKKVKKDVAAESQAVPSPNGRKLTRTEQLRIAAATKKKTTASKSKTTTTSARSKGPTKGVAQGRLVLNRKSESVLPKHPMPFASKNMYYDERWIEKQERGFTRWLNFILTPLDDVMATKQKVDASKLCVDTQKYNDKLAPTKEVLSFRAYTARRNLNKLRRSACRLFQSDAIVTVIQKVEREIEGGRLMVRKDRKLRADLGIKQKILDMVLSYNPLWLRIGLETTYGEILPIQKTTDVMGLSRFVLSRMLENPDIAKEYAHPTVPHLFREGYDVMMAKFTLKKFLMLVFFLDQAKQHRLIEHNPCLFCKDCDFKTSRDLLIQFNKDYLSGEGDLTKHLSYLRYNVSHVQTALEEYDFAVSNLALDLRDGLRLTRVVEMLTQNWQLSKSLRAPAISRLQKIHNVEVAFKELINHGVELEGLRGGRVSPRDVVDGHREKTLGVLWQIIFKFQVDMLINEKQLREEIAFLQNNFRLQRDLAKVSEDEESRYLGIPRDQDTVEPEMYFKSERLTLLLKWCKAVCVYYGVQVENFTVSFSDGRAMCYLLHHYHPSLLPSRYINQKTMLTHNLREDDDESGDESFDGSAPWAQTFSPSTGKPTVYNDLLANEKENFKILYDAVSELGGVPIMVKSTDMSNTIPDEKVVITYVSYLCARLLDIREETRAARKIQAAWRRYWIHSKIKHNQVKLQAIVTIQKAWKLYYRRKKAMLQNRAAMRLQAIWRGHRIRKMIADQKRRALLARQTEAASCIQNHFRSYLQKKRRQQSVAASIVIQSVWRGYWARLELLRQKAAADIIQERYRGWCTMLQQRAQFLQMRYAAVVIQSAVRHHLENKHKMQHQAAVLIQSNWRCYCARVRFVKMRRAAVTIQAFARKNRAQMKFWRMKVAAFKIQQWYRALRDGRRTREEFVVLRNAVVTIQSALRNWLARRLERKEEAAVTIQAMFRMNKERSVYLQKKKAAVRVQAWYRRHAAVKSYTRTKQAALVIQERFQALKLQRQCREEFVNKVNAVVRLQAAYRGHMARVAYEFLQKVVVGLQAIVRRNIARRRYLKMKEAVGVIEMRYLAYQLGFQQWQMFNIQKGAAITIQAAWRRTRAQKEYRYIRSSAIVIQSYFKMMTERQRFMRMQAACVTLQRSYRALCLKRTQQAEFLRMKTAAETIQACFRSYQCKRRFQSMRCAAIIIQKNVRCHQARVSYIGLQHASVVIQRCFRALVIARLQHSEYKQLKQGAVIIQTLFRGWKCRRWFIAMKSAAVVVQKIVRGQQARARFESMKKAALTIQRYWKATLAARLQEKDYLCERRAIIKVQACVRSFVVRKEYLWKRGAAVKIQSALRGFQEQKRYQELKTVTIQMQRRFRSLRLTQLKREEYNAMKLAAVKIQSIVRGFLVRRSAQIQNRAAIVIQAMFRSYVAKKQYSAIQKATLVLQDRARKVLEFKKARAEFLEMKKSAILIQAYFRGFSTRAGLQRQRQAATRIQAHFRCYMAQKDYLAVRQGAVIIQRYYRSLMRMREERDEYLVMKGAAITIQAAVRGFLIRRDLERQHSSAKKIQAYFRRYMAVKEYRGCRKAVVTIQKHYRSLLAMQQQRREFLRMKSAAVTIQVLYRGYCTRRTIQKQHDAAQGIQACYRGYKARVAYRSCRNAVVTIQRHFRTLLAMQKQRCKFLRMKSAAVTIQALYRGYCTRSILQIQQQAAQRIQAYYRGYKAREEYCGCKNAAIIIQKHYRSLLAMRLCRHEFLRTKSAAVTIQALYRGNYVRRVLQTQHAAAQRIQACYRGYKARVEYCGCRNAAVSIQRHYRSLLVMRQCRHEFLTMKSVAVTIQALYRGYCTRRTIHKQHEAATKIQACYRGYKARVEYCGCRNAAVSIQKHYRSLLAMQQSRHKFLRMKSAALMIQALYRGYCTRRTIKKQHDAAIMIQASYRGYIARVHYLVYKNAAVTIQKHFMLYLAMREQRFEFLIMKGAAITIQAAVRGLLVRRDLGRQNNAAERVQAYYRGHKAREQYVQCRNAASTIQRYYRAWMARRQDRQDYVTMKAAAISIQSLFRGFLLRRNIQKQNAAAVKIQAVFRGYKARAQYLERSSATVCIQRHFRALLAMRNARYEYLVMKGAAMTIQAWYRGYRVRLSMKVMSKAACTIQANYRAHHARNKFKRLRAATVTIQRKFRGLLLMKQEKDMFLTKRASASLIQSVYRGYVQRSRFLRMRKAAVVIQAQIRMCHAKAAFEKTRTAAVVIQRCYRNCLLGKKCQEQYRATRMAVLTIQSAVRRFLAWRALQRQRAATLVQAVWKMHKCRSKYIQQLQAARTIQSLWRMHQTRLSFTKKKSAAIVIQRHWRATLLARAHQQDFLVCVGASIVIQASVRAFIVRRQYLKTRDLIVKLQSMVRAQQERRRFNRLRAASVVLHRRVRATFEARKQHRIYTNMKAAAIAVQTLWRQRQARRRVQEIRAAILIQSFYRMYREQQRYQKSVHLVIRMQALVRGMIQKAKFKKTTSAVAVIQSCYRGYRTRKEIQRQKKLREEYLSRIASVVQRNLHVIRIQRCLRRHLSLRRAKERIDSVLRIQGWMRARLERLHFLKKRAATLRIQAATRKWLQRREAAAIKIQAAVRGWLDRKNIEQRTNSANLIQAWWRGHKLRNSIKNVKIHQARKRIAVANREATEDKKLCNRTTSALEYLLVCRQLAAILEALMHLEIATRLSPHCCERMVNDNAVPVLYTLMKGCNRSVAHMELIRYSLDVLLNLAKYDKTRDGVCVEGAIETIIHQMQIFLGKGDIFTKACTLLGVIAQDEHRREEITENKIFKDKIQSIHSITSRKHKMKERQQVMKSKMAPGNGLQHPTPWKQPKVMSPFWVLRKNKMKEIKEPLPAINFVMNVLHLAPKS